jgi:CRP-like cAMP-binding protein
MLNEPTTAIGLRDRLLLVHSINNLGELSEHAMVLLAEHAKERHFQAGELIRREGTPISVVHFVVRGEVVVSRKGTELIVAVDGGTIGMVSLLARDPWGVKAVARTPSHTLEIPAEVILDVYEESRSFLRAAIKYSALGLLGRRGNLPVSATYEPGDDLGVRAEQPPTLVERIIEMRTNPLFADRNLDAVVDLARIGEWVTIEPGTPVWEIGDEASFYLAMSYGRLRCTTADGKTACVAGNYTLGIMDSLGQSPRTYRAVAETELQGVKVDVRGMLVVLETHHDLAMDLLANISWRLLPHGPDEN